MEKKTLWKRIRERWEEIIDRLQHNVVTGVNGGGPLFHLGPDLPGEESIKELATKSGMSPEDTKILLNGQVAAEQDEPGRKKTKNGIPQVQQQAQTTIQAPESQSTRKIGPRRESGRDQELE